MLTGLNQCWKIHKIEACFVAVGYTLFAVGFRVWQDTTIISTVMSQELHLSVANKV